MSDYLNYKAMVEDALRGVVRTALLQVAESGLRANHHLYISFSTDHLGVVVSEYLHGKYPNEMTIVLQHQYWDLEIGDDLFDVTLTFNKVPERLTVPFAALTGFADPGVQFGLQFQGDGAANMDVSQLPTASAGLEPLDLEELRANAATDETGENDADSDNDGEAPGSNDANVVALDQFRKK
jgi:hypothetical protein